MVIAGSSSEARDCWAVRRVVEGVSSKCWGGCVSAFGTGLVLSCAVLLEQLYSSELECVSSSDQKVRNAV